MSRHVHVFGSVALLERLFARALAAFATAALVAFATAALSAQSLEGGGAATKENLDLPFDAMGENEEEEDAPEIVTFYGQQLEGDGFFYVIDKSGSMRDSGELAIAKREVIRNITEFSERVQFGIVFFDASVVKFPPSGQPAEANPAMKAAGITFVQGVNGNSGSCCMEGMMQCLNLANMASSRRVVMVYLGDGGGTCNGADEATYLRRALGAVTSANYKRLQINTIGILNPGALQEDFMKKLAASNGGTYTRKTS